jgi:hypothetical protein
MYRWGGGFTALLAAISVAIYIGTADGSSCTAVEALSARLVSN